MEAPPTAIAISEEEILKGDSLSNHQQHHHPHTAAAIYADVPVGMVLLSETPAQRQQQPIVAVRDENLEKVIKSLRMHAHVMFFFSWLTPIVPGSIFGAPIDWFFMVVTYILILVSTASPNLAYGHGQHYCCGFRHVYGMTITTIVFHVIFSIARISTNYALVPSYEIEIYNSFVDLVLILQPIATVSTGITMYCLWVIVSLSAPAKYLQCYTTKQILSDPADYQQLKQPCCAMRIVGGVMIALTTLLVLIVYIVLAPYQDCSTLPNDPSCCREAFGVKVECRENNNTLNDFNLPENNDNLGCQCIGACARSISLFFPTSSTNVTTSFLIQRMVNFNDLVRAPFCTVRSGCFKSIFNKELSENVAICDMSRYNCSNPVPSFGKICGADEVIY